MSAYKLLLDARSFDHFRCWALRIQDIDKVIGCILFESFLMFFFFWFLWPKEAFLTLAAFKIDRRFFRSSFVLFLILFSDTTLHFLHISSSAIKQQQRWNLKRPQFIDLRSVLLSSNDTHHRLFSCTCNVHDILYLLTICWWRFCVVVRRRIFRVDGVLGLSRCRLMWLHMNLFFVSFCSQLENKTTVAHKSPTIWCIRPFPFQVEMFNWQPY